MRRRTRVIAGASAASALVGGGAAVAAGQLGGFEEEQAAVLAAAAAQLGVEPSELSEALTDALSARLDAAVADGTLGEEAAAELQARLADGEVPLLGLRRGGGGPHGGFGLRGGPGPLGGLAAAAAASFLGLGEAELREELAGGATLAELAEARGKIADGLEAALLASARADLADAVEDGRLSEEQRDAILEGLPARIAGLVDGSLGHDPPRGRAVLPAGSDEGARTDA